ncbi:hypothetical protein [Streptomyces sp. NBC_00690]|uniref:hypothetical protein n=1 Tax=Streptomyces sp. NBC_00690 TaxID=2975808 RepID=UPI002E2CD496|nr:hypothetical protein [Streptomyces sp. NBC_00690]
MRLLRDHEVERPVHLGFLGSFIQTTQASAGTQAEEPPKAPKATAEKPSDPN